MTCFDLILIIIMKRVERVELTMCFQHNDVEGKRNSGMTSIRSYMYLRRKSKYLYLAFVYLESQVEGEWIL